MDRRTFLSASAVLPIAASLPHSARAESRTFTPAPGPWRTFEVTTRLEIADAGTGTRAWIPVPVVNTDWQQSLDSTWSGNLREATLQSDPVYGAKMVCASWADDEKSPAIEVMSRIRSRDRGVDWAQKRTPKRRRSRARPESRGDRLDADRRDRRHDGREDRRRQDGRCRAYARDLRLGRRTTPTAS